MVDRYYVDVSSSTILPADEMPTGGTRNSVIASFQLVDRSRGRVVAAFYDVVLAQNVADLLNATEKPRA